MSLPSGTERYNRQRIHEAEGKFVRLSVLATGTGSLAGLLYGLNINKGWIPPAAIVIPAEIITQVVLCLTFEFSSVHGILLISILGPITPGLINLVVGIQKLKSKTLIESSSET